MLLSHSIKLYVAYRYEKCHCLAALPPKISVFNCNDVCSTKFWGGQNVWF